MFEQAGDSTLDLDHLGGSACQQMNGLKVWKRQSKKCGMIHMVIGKLNW